MIVSNDLKSTVSRVISTVGRALSTISRVLSTDGRPKWRKNLLKMMNEHGIMYSVQDEKRTGLTGRHCSEQRYYVMSSSLIIEVLMDDQGALDLFFTPYDSDVPTHCLLDLESYNAIFPTFKLSDLFYSYFYEKGKWQECASFITDSHLVCEFYSEAITNSDTVAIFKLNPRELSSLYFAPIDCFDNKYSFFARLKKILSV